MVQPLKSGDGDKPRPHILMVPLDFVGHFFSFLQLLYHMARYRNDGLIVTVMSGKQKIAELVKLRSKGEFGNIDLRLTEVFGDIPPLTTDTNFPFRTKEIVEHLREDFEPFARKLAQEKNMPGGPTALVVDFVLVWLDDLANELGIPWYPFYSMGPGYGLSAFHTPTLVAEGLQPYDSPKRDLDVTIPGLEFCRVRDLMADLVDYKEYYFLHSEKMSKARALIFNTAENADALAGTLNALRAGLHDRKGKEAPPVLAIGPFLNCPGFMIQQPNTTLQKEPCLEFLDSQAPSSVLYVSFGSITQISAKLVIEVALGLEASGVPFLWVFRSRQLEKSASELLPPGFEERTSARGFVETGWAPQTRILAHPSTGGFWSHCGWNSTLESMCLGVPVLTWPMSADQGYGARFLEIAAKTAIPLKGMTEDATKEEVERGVKLLMVGEKTKELRKNAMIMKRHFEEAMSEGGSSGQALEWLSNELLKIPNS